ncbi:MAG: SUMF1/EgtB/PvdO family nonheme iron enzyme [Acidobacteria bacterium]|nr:SUMF1/EgtB/PvdO family nonheme iron enzyme [Acidobacteriota bacterium]
MARIRLALVLLAFTAFAQQKEDRQFKEAGVCARCHVISVVEWGMSAHQRAGTGCISCHGASLGHVEDERNNVKPGRMPRSEKIAALCLGCHTKTKTKTDCQKCHHFHALVDPRKPAVAAAETERPRPAVVKPARAHPPRANVEVAGVAFDLVLVPGGEAEIGSERFPRTKPVHTVKVAPFYLGKFEVTQAQWKALRGETFSEADRGPAEQVSWEDAQAFVSKLNDRVPGGGFRLPAEAEWECAARSAGKLGLSAMLGGVWEWCSSLDRAYPYDASDGREDAAAPGMRILRGGGEADSPLWVDVSARHAERPARRLRWNGLRIARSIP